MPIIKIVDFKAAAVESTAAYRPGVARNDQLRLSSENNLTTEFDVQPAAANVFKLRKTGLLQEHLKRDALKTQTESVTSETSITNTRDENATSPAKELIAQVKKRASLSGGPVPLTSPDVSIAVTSTPAKPMTRPGAFIAGKPRSHSASSHLLKTPAKLNSIYLAAVEASTQNIAKGVVRSSTENMLSGQLNNVGSLIKLNANSLDTPSQAKIQYKLAGSSLQCPTAHNFS